MNLLIFLPPFQSLLTDFAATLRGFNGFPRAVEGLQNLAGCRLEVVEAVADPAA